VPRFEIVRAHHNKVVQEVLRSTLPITGHEGPSARVYGTLDELIGEASQMRLPAVVKAAEGAGSRNVFLARSQDSLLQIARRMSRTWHTVDAGKEFVKRMVRPYHKRRSNHRGKFIVQEFVPDLTGDYKILVYGRRYYVLERRNRPSDFRASGSGRFSYPEAAPPGLLEAARAITCALKVPFVSLDVAVSNDRVYLLEWQGINFGNYTLERSSWHFIERDGVFTRQDGASELEEIVVEAVTGYCEANGYWTGQVEGLGSVDPAPRIIG
jgi:hypothetical protein